ncbi:hypothetical protein BDFB_007314, partial [Asbolus verrucosus]
MRDGLVSTHPETRIGRIPAALGPTRSVLGGFCRPRYSPHSLPPSTMAAVMPGMLYSSTKNVRKCSPWTLITAVLLTFTNFMSPYHQVYQDITERKITH